MAISTTKLVTDSLCPAAFASPESDQKKFRNFSEVVKISWV
jgi:hypothetical protein